MLPRSEDCPLLLGRQEGRGQGHQAGGGVGPSEPDYGHEVLLSRPLAGRPEDPVPGGPPHAPGPGLHQVPQVDEDAVWAVLVERHLPPAPLQQRLQPVTAAPPEEGEAVIVGVLPVQQLRAGGGGGLVPAGEGELGQSWGAGSPGQPELCRSLSLLRPAPGQLPLLHAQGQGGQGQTGPQHLRVEGPVQPLAGVPQPVPSPVACLGPGEGPQELLAVAALQGLPLKLGDYISGRIFRRENPAAKSQNWKQGQMEPTPWSVQTVAWQCSGLETPPPQ